MADFNNIACLKKPYTTRSEAKKAMKLLNKSHNLKNNLTNIYFCEKCSQYHLTTLPKQASRDFTRYLNKRK